MKKVNLRIVFRILVLAQVGVASSALAGDIAPKYQCTVTEAQDALGNLLQGFSLTFMGPEYPSYLVGKMGRIKINRTTLSANPPSFLDDLLVKEIKVDPKYPNVLHYGLEFTEDDMPIVKDYLKRHEFKKKEYVAWLSVDKTNPAGAKFTWVYPDLKKTLGPSGHRSFPARCVDGAKFKKALLSNPNVAYPVGTIPGDTNTSGAAAAK